MNDQIEYFTVIDSIVTEIDKQLVTNNEDTDWAYETAQIRSQELVENIQSEVTLAKIVYEFGMNNYSTDRYLYHSPDGYDDTLRRSLEVAAEEVIKQDIWEEIDEDI